MTPNVFSLELLDTMGQHPKNVGKRPVIGSRLVVEGEGRGDGDVEQRQVPA